MKAKEYMMQARYLDLRIKSKTEQMQQMRDLAVQVTQLISDMPKAPSGSKSRMADTVSKIVDLETEIGVDMERLILLKKVILNTLKKLSEPEYGIVLEERYLKMNGWEDIAVNMNRSLRSVQQIHGKALVEVQEILDQEEK